jgi:seryl-tRNA synthetase
MKFIQPPKGTEDNVGAGSALVPVEILGHASKELVLDERQGSRQAEEWLNNLADDAVKEYLAAPDGKGEAAAQLRVAWTIRTDWKRLTDEAERLQSEQNDLQTSTEETRENLRAVEKNKAAEDLRRTLTARLTKASARLDEVTKRLIQVHMQIKELELRFREAVKLVRIPARA